MTKYTFLLPAYKGRFLDEMLRSIQGQTYTDFKVLISDDCSPEDLYSICEPYLSDPRFTYRRNEENMGSKSLVSHWNLLVDMCDTDYLIMASDDDIYEPQFLAEIDRLVQKYPNVNLFRTRVKIIDGEGYLLEEDILLEEYQKQFDFIYFLLGPHTIKCIANYVYKTSVLKKEGYFYNLPLAWSCDTISAVVLSENGVGNTHSCNFSFRRSNLHISSQFDLFSMREKMRERYMGLQFLERYIQRLSSKVSNQKEREQYEKIKCFYKIFYVKDLYDHSDICSFAEMKEYYRYLKHIGFITGKLERIHFLWSWLRAYKSRKMN